jgi:hypothetical protein
MVSTVRWSCIGRAVSDQFRALDAFLRPTASMCSRFSTMSLRKELTLVFRYAFANERFCLTPKAPIIWELCTIDHPERRVLVRMSMSELAICTNPLAREVLFLWHLDRVMDTQGGVHDSSTPAHAGRSPAPQLFRTHDSSLHPYTSMPSRHRGVSGQLLAILAVCAKN